ncbi:MAG: GNAT family N-acetyltransferase [Cyclobacteriaceae bacterium]
MLPRTILENHAVRLTPFQKGDWQLLQELAKDPHLWGHFPEDLSKEGALQNWTDSKLKLMETGSWLPYLVYSKTYNQYVGMTCYLNIDEAHGGLEIGGTWYGSKFHGTDVNPNCKLLMMTNAFESLNMQRVEYKTDALNERSRRAITKLGAKQEGILRSNRIVQNERRRDTVYFSILANEWPEVKANLTTRIEKYQ